MLSKVKSYHVPWLYSGTILVNLNFPTTRDFFSQEFQESQINKKLQGHFKTERNFHPMNK